jgi:hypothetical protein
MQKQIVPMAKGKFLSLLCAAGLLGRAAFANEPITLTINASDPGSAISTNFTGISVSSMSIDGDGGYTKCFTTANTQMVNLFKQIGIKHLRTIMGKAQSSNPDPSNSQIDSFFDFAAAAGVNKIIWSLHLYDAEVTTNWSNNKAVAAHIWSTTTSSGTVESNLLESFAFDNEPDWLSVICCADPAISGYSTPSSNGGYIGVWKGWQQSIAAIAPGAQFSGPDTGSKYPCPGEIDTAISGVPFTLRFATDAASLISAANQHFYGQTGISNFTTLQLAEACLSSNWLTTNYADINSDIVGSLPMPYRFTECSAFDNEKNPGNQCFATALWAVDFYHWWARHGCAGVDPFTRTVQYNSPIYFDGSDYNAVAYAYGMKAFNLGAGGNVIYTGKFLVGNPGNLNVTAYGVVNSNHLYVTVVNKTFSAVGSYTADVSIPAPAGFTVQSARYIVLSAGAAPGASGDPTITGACLGGAEIPNDGSAWSGTWTNLAVSGGGINLSVLPTTAVVIDLQGTTAAQPPVIQSAAKISGAIAFTWSTMVGRSYQVQCATHLSPANWTNIGVALPATNITMTTSEPISASSPQFYRIELLP